MTELYNLIPAWMRKWDFMAILYSLVASVLFAVGGVWSGGFKFLIQRYRAHRGIRNYRNHVKENCSSLIVIGRRTGFSTEDVYVPLDLAPSALAQSGPQPSAAATTQYVIVAGPGAGKSTVVKKMVLDYLAETRSGAPFFLRLRDFTGSSSIESFLADQFRAQHIPNPEQELVNRLASSRCLCVLDGLDEVRPAVKTQVCNRINEFYHRFFPDPRAGRLVVTCRKEAYRSIPLDIPTILEVRPLTDEQIKRFSVKWPLGYPKGKSPETFWRDLASTPRIHELARSPLLLVGGLMQYTESNLGIPEERVEYLARIAHWLAADWAAAQGHPPDPYRAVYGRLLAKLAFHIHSSESSECARQDAIARFREWLPLYGFSADDADAVLDSITRRTGILVRDLPSTVIFSQFGLQEYYASVDALELLGVDGLRDRSSSVWWHEVVLLALAQAKEPSQYLDSLFACSPLLAAAAVAECATPAVSAQEQAIHACLRGIDAGEESARSAALALLRKVRGIQEEKFITSLESRLGTGPTVAAAVGLVLATAGTAAATAALVRHPSIWSTCLQGAGYLSSSFEDLLVQWIQDGDEIQSAHARDLLASRLSEDRFDQLSTMLDHLSTSRSDALARMLLCYVDGTFAENRYDLGVDLIEKVSRCAVHVSDVDQEPFPDPSRNSFSRLHLSAPICRLASKVKGTRSERKVVRIVVNAILWSSGVRDAYLGMIASALCFCSAALLPGQKPLLLSALVCLSTMVGVSRGILIPMYRRGSVRALLAVFVGASFAIAWLRPKSLFVAGQIPGQAVWLLALAYALFGIAGMSERFSRVRIPVSMRLNMGSWFLALLTLMFLTSKPYFRHIELVCGALGLTVYGGIALLLWSDFHRFSSAAEEERSRAAKALVD